MDLEHKLRIRPRIEPSCLLNNLTRRTCATSASLRLRLCDVEVPARIGTETTTATASKVWFSATTISVVAIRPMHSLSAPHVARTKLVTIKALVDICGWLTMDRLVVLARLLAHNDVFAFVCPRQAVSST
jgi:hypothetical protein